MKFSLVYQMKRLVSLQSNLEMRIISMFIPSSNSNIICFFSIQKLKVEYDCLIFCSTVTYDSIEEHLYRKLTAAT